MLTPTKIEDSPRVIRSCTGCFSMKSKIPIWRGEFIREREVARCTDKRGMQHRVGEGDKTFAMFNRKEYLEWRIWGNTCPYYDGEDGNNGRTDKGK